MEIKDIEQGVHPDGIKWRIRKIGDYYYYSENLCSRTFGGLVCWNWVVIDIHPDLINIRSKVNKYSCEKQEYMDFMKKGKCND